MTDKQKSHTANRLFEDYTKIWAFSPERAQEILCSVLEAAAGGGKNEADAAKQFLIQIINLDDEILIPEALILRHTDHLRHRQNHQARVFTQTNLRALDAINSHSRREITGPDAYALHWSYWLKGCRPDDQRPADGEPEPTA